MADIATPHTVLNAMVNPVRKISGTEDVYLMATNPPVMVITLTNGQVFRVTAIQDDYLTEVTQARMRGNNNG